MLEIDPEATLNDLVAAEPRLLTVLHRYGLDTCCGGAPPLHGAARRHDLSLDACLARSGYPSSTRMTSGSLSAEMLTLRLTPSS